MKFQPVHDRHINIRNDDVDRLAEQDIEAFLAVSRKEDRPALILKKTSDENSVFRLIVDDEDVHPA